MGGGSKTTTSNANEQASTAPQTPNYTLDPVKNYYAGINNYQQADPYSFVTPANSLQTAAYQNAGGLFGANSLYGQAAAGAQGVMGAAPTTAQATAQYAGPAAQATSASLLDNFAAYQNPATQQLVDTRMADFDQNADLVRGQQVADAARNRGFGGSGYHFAQAATDGQLARARDTANGQARYDAFAAAAGLAGQDADRRQATGLFNAGATNDNSNLNAQLGTQVSQFNSGQTNDMQNSQLNRQLQASGLLGDIAGQYGQNYRADLGMQADLGNQLYQIQDRAANAPLTQLQNIGNLLNPGLIDSLSGKTITSQNSGVEQSKQSGGLFNSLLGAASIAAPFIPSDRRLKENIHRVGKTDGGLPIYSYRYKGDDRTQIGVMAQDVEVMQPAALGPIWRGFKTVNYAEIR